MRHVEVDQDDARHDEARPGDLINEANKLFILLVIHFQKCIISVIAESYSNGAQDLANLLQIQYMFAFSEKRQEIPTIFHQN